MAVLAFGESGWKVYGNSVPFLQLFCKLEIMSEWKCKKKKNQDHKKNVTNQIRLFSGYQRIPPQIEGFSFFFLFFLFCSTELQTSRVLLLSYQEDDLSTKPVIMEGLDLMLKQDERATSSARIGLLSKNQLNCSPVYWLCLSEAETVSLGKEET